MKTRLAALMAVWHVTLAASVLVPKGNLVTRNACWGGRWDEIEKIGLYASEDRASWPVRHQVRPAPEPPVPAKTR